MSARTVAVVVTLVAAGVIGVVCAVAVHSVIATAPAPAPTTSWTRYTTPTIPTTTPSVSHELRVADGQYEVGKDIPVGKYKTAGSTDGNCYYEVAKDLDGSATSVLINGNTSGPAYVSLKAGRYFTSRGCQPWKKVG